MKNISKIAVHFVRRATVYQYSSYLIGPRHLYCYSSSPRANPTLTKLQSGISLSDIDTTLQDISAMSSEDRLKALTLMLEGI